MPQEIKIVIGDNKDKKETSSGIEKRMSAIEKALGRNDWSGIKSQIKSIKSMIPKEREEKDDSALVSKIRMIDSRLSEVISMVSKVDKKVSAIENSDNGFDVGMMKKLIRENTPEVRHQRPLNAVTKQDIEALERKIGKIRFPESILVRQSGDKIVPYVA